MELEQHYPELIAKRILARAIEVDQVRGVNYSLAELRSIAAEAGVSEVALDQALRELQPRAQDSERKYRNLNSLVCMAAAGTAVGAISGVTDVTTYFVSSPIAMGVLLMISGAVAVLGDYQKPMRGFLRFQFRNTSLWLVYAATWALAALSAGGAGPVSTVFFGRSAILGWTMSTIFGTLLPAFNAWRNRSRTLADCLEGTVPLKRRIADRLKGWLDDWARRVAVTDQPPTTTTGASAG